MVHEVKREGIPKEVRAGWCARLSGITFIDHLCLQELGVEYVDLMLIHYPGKDAKTRKDQWCVRTHAHTYAGAHSHTNTLQARAREVGDLGQGARDWRLALLQKPRAGGPECGVLPDRAQPKPVPHRHG
jgi:hypothetical protein